MEADHLEKSNDNFVTEKNLKNENALTPINIQIQDTNTNNNNGL